MHCAIQVIETIDENIIVTNHIHEIIERIDTKTGTPDEMNEIMTVTRIMNDEVAGIIVVIEKIEVVNIGRTRQS